MLSRLISGFTGTLTPNDATKLLLPEMRQVPARLKSMGETKVISTAWEPTQQELQLLIAGASLVVTTASQDPAMISVVVEAAIDPVPELVTAEKRAALTLATIDALINTHTLMEGAQMLGRLLGRVIGVASDRNWSAQFIALFVASAQSKALEVAKMKLDELSNHPSDNKETPS
jgi:hypothetical protein